MGFKPELFGYGFTDEEDLAKGILEGAFLGVAHNAEDVTKIVQNHPDNPIIMFWDSNRPRPLMTEENAVKFFERKTKR